MLLAIAAAGLLFAQAEAQAAAPAAPAASAAAAKPAPEKPKQICHNETQTGSNFSKRICHTAEEWKAINDAAREQSEALRNCKNGLGC